MYERLPPSSPRLEGHRGEVHSLPGGSPGSWVAGMGQPGASSPMPISRSQTEEGRGGLGRSSHQGSVLPPEVAALPPQILSRGRAQLLPGSYFHLAGSLSVQGAWHVQVGCCTTSFTHCTDPGAQPWAWSAAGTARPLWRRTAGSGSGLVSQASRAGEGPWLSATRPRSFPCPLPRQEGAWPARGL